MLAYLFWHRPIPDVDVNEYEDAQRAFHASLENPSACFRVVALPFERRGGYEDWYLVEDWAGFGELNEAAVDTTRREHHDRAGSMAAAGWGGLYELARGPAEIPAGTEWRDKPRGMPAAEFLDSLAATTVWRRQLVLGPAPEFCLAAPASSARVSVWPRLNPTARA